MKRFLQSLSLITAIVLLIALTGYTSGEAKAQDVRLSESGHAKCVIVVPQGTMSMPEKPMPYNVWGPWAQEPQRRQQLQRESVNDLANYLGQITGSKVEIVESLPPGDKRLPILIGDRAQESFGPVGKSFGKKYGFRVAITDKAIGLYGESEYGTSYAIYELLHQLGCRWYMPSEMGECIPSDPNLKIAPSDRSLAPATLWRRMEVRTADADFRRRNRMGGSHDNGDVISAYHCLENYITPEQRQANPDWCLQVDGKPHPRFLRWTRQDVADAIADAIIAKLDKEYTPSISLSPGDYVVPTEDPEEMKADPNPRVWEPAANRWSVSDRLVLLCNRVAERVTKKYPDVKFGVLIYVNYSMPPKLHKLHPSVIPMIAPIDFNRHHPMTWENHPDGKLVYELIDGWSKVASTFAYYAYGMNLAEISAPNPFITKWSTDLPIILGKGCLYWAPETMGGWESMMPAFYMSTRVTFDPTLKPDQVIDELLTRFYGNAAEPMKRYWYGIDKAWIDAREYSGSGFGYLKIFTPQVMASARQALNEALEKCQTITEYRRVELIDESFSLFERFMKMRRDWATGKLSTLASDLDDWRGSVRHLRQRYKNQFVLGGLTLDYVNFSWGAPYEDGTRITREYVQLAPPMMVWKYQPDTEKQAEAAGWTAESFDDKPWKSTHVVEETWSTLGMHQKMGTVVYRSTTRLNPLPAGKRAWLWIGSTDGSAKVYVNGKPVPYVMAKKTRTHEKGDVVEKFNGYCEPAMWDVTDFIKTGPNQVTIVCERNWLNELGTGGLMGPVVMVRSK